MGPAVAAALAALLAAAARAVDVTVNVASVTNAAVNKKLLGCHADYG